MKINKITLFVCSILTVVSGLTMLVIERTVPDNIDTSLCQSVVSGIFTGFIVSLVTFMNAILFLKKLIVTLRASILI